MSRQVRHPDVVAALHKSELYTLTAWARAARVSWTQFGLYRRTGHIPRAARTRLAQAIQLPESTVEGLITKGRLPSTVGGHK